MTHRTLGQCLAEADHLGLGPNQTINARVKTLPDPITATFAAPSLRGAIRAALTTGTDPLLAVRDLKSEHLSIYARCEELIAHAEKRAVHMVAAADYISSKSDNLPAGADPRLIECCTSIRAAKAAGFDTSGSIAEDLRDAARTALRRIKAAAALNDRRKAAWHVAYAKNMAAQMKRYADLPGDAQKRAVFQRAGDRYAVAAHRASAAFASYKSKHEALRDG